MLLTNFSVFNVQGLIPQTKSSSVTFISDVLHDSNQLFICLTETWLSNHREAESEISGYKFYHADCKKLKKSTKGRHTGGVAMYVRNDLAASMSCLLSFSNGVCDALVLYSSIEHLAIVTFYRKPDSQYLRSTVTEFKGALKAISSALASIDGPDPTLIIAGDFNLPGVDWESGKLKSGVPSVVKHCYLELDVFIHEQSLFQYVTEPTHFQGNTLDLVFTNSQHLIYELQCIDTLQSVSHHKIIEVKTHFQLSNMCKYKDTPQEETLFFKLNFHEESIDWSSLSDALASIDWVLEFKKLTLDQVAERFIEISVDCAQKYVPEKKKFARKSNFIPRSRRILMARRRRINKRLLHMTSPSNKLKLKLELVEIEKKLQKSHVKSRADRETKAIQLIKKNSKSFFSYAKQFSKLKPQVGPLKDGDSVVSDRKGMAELLAAQFSSVYSSPKDILPSADSMFANDEFGINDIPLSEDDFIEVSDELKLFTGSGPDGFPAIYLKRCKYAFAKPLAIMWKRSMTEGYIPKCFKKTDTLPLFKKGSSGIPENYRPISNSSHLIKLFERVIKKYLVQYLEENNLFNPNQHGFRHKHSCISQLLAHYDEIIHQIERGCGIDVVYLDFSKAFDKVDFDILLNKVKKCGIGGKLGRWLHCFLTGRTQQVVVNGVKSGHILVKSGVPQGSVLGPLLFLILISDIDADVKSSLVSSFADDTKASHGVRCSQDVDNFQCDLNVIYSWAENNNMVFNNMKFELVRYDTPKSLSNTSYMSSDQETIEAKEVVTDLGVLMSSNASFSDQIQKVSSSMRHMSSWILRTFASRNKEVMLTTWKSLVLPIHDYCSQLWNPHKHCEIQTFELIQWSFLRKINDGNHMDYWDCLSKYCIYSLQRRRERYLIIYIWKILEGLVPNPVINSRNSSGNFIECYYSQRLGRFCRVPTLNSISSNRIKTLKFNSFHVNSCRLFNSLPMNIRNISDCTVDYFKMFLDQFLCSVPDYPHLPGLRKFCPTTSNSLISVLEWQGQLN